MIENQLILKLKFNIMKHLKKYKTYKKIFSLLPIIMKIEFELGHSQI